MKKKSFSLIGFIVSVMAFIMLTTLNLEYLVNQSDSTFLLILAIIIQGALFYFTIFKSIKKLIKKKEVVD